MKNKEIAKRLGISAASVSLALNNRPGVSDKTRSQVLRLKNSDIESQLHVKKPVIQFIIHKASGAIIDNKPFFANLVSTLQQESLRYDYQLNVFYFTPDMPTDVFIRAISSPDAAGTILLATELSREDLDMYRTLPQPLILIDGLSANDRYDTVTISNRTSVLHALSFAYGMGHRKIGYLKSRFPISNFEERFDGYLDGLNFYGLDVDSCPVIELDCSIEGAYRSMSRYLDTASKLPTIFLCDLDYIALGAARALKEHGYRVPEDVSVIGFDDIAECEAFDPPLTTLRVDNDDIGKFGVRLLHDRITNPAMARTDTQISTQLIERGSTRAN